MRIHNIHRWIGPLLVLTSSKWILSSSSFRLNAVNGGAFTDCPLIIQSVRSSTNTNSGGRSHKKSRRQSSSLYFHHGQQGLDRYSSSFISITPRRSYPHSAASNGSGPTNGGGGLTWDNSNFLDALSSQGSAVAMSTSPLLQKVNEEYYQQSQYNLSRRRLLMAKAFPEDDPIEGEEEEHEELTGNIDVPPHLIKKPKPVIDEENPTGGQMFRKMLEKANKAGGGRRLTPDAEIGMASNDNSAVNNKRQQEPQFIPNVQQQAQAAQQQQVTFQQGQPFMNPAFPAAATASPPNLMPPYMMIPPITTTMNTPPYTMPNNNMNMNNIMNLPPNMPTIMPSMGQPSNIMPPTTITTPQQLLQPTNLYMDPQQAYYQTQLQLWQQQMMAYAQLSVLNPQAAASMTMPPPPLPTMMNMYGGGGFGTSPIMPQVSSPMMGYPTTTTPSTMMTASTTTVPPIAPSPTESNPSSKQLVQDLIPKPPGKANRDAYDIANAADVYFAQLKRDSTVRTLARQVGDTDTANKPFADEGVQALKNYFSEISTDERKIVREKSNELYTTSREEMLLPPSQEEFVDEATKIKQMKESGVKFKQLMEQKLMKKKKETKDKGGEDVRESSNNVQNKNDKNVNSENNQPTPTVTTSTIIQPGAVRSSSSSPTVSSSTDNHVNTSSLNTYKTVSIESAASFPAVTNTHEESKEGDLEENRKMIRTCMGLLLKHRGGAGFGSGRLKSPEDTKLVESFSKVIEFLKSEMDVGLENATLEESTTNSPTLISKPSLSPCTEETLVHDSPLRGALECVQSVVTMFKSADKAQQDELLVSVRDALMSAVKVVNQAIAEKEEAKTVVVDAQSTLTFPEKYYFASDVSMLRTEGEKIDYDEELEEEDDIDSTARLQEIYKKLQTFQGDEKFGVKKMSSGEMSSLSDILSDMRGILMDELES